MRNDDLNLLYQDTILDHYKNPRGLRILGRKDAENKGFNPLCGDKVDISVEIEGNIIKDVAVVSNGCAISVASGSMLAELLPGKSIAEAEEISKAFDEMMHGSEMPEEIDYGDLDVLEGVNKFHARIKCALIAWQTLDELIEEWKAKTGSNN